MAWNLVSNIKGPPGSETTITAGSTTALGTAATTVSGLSVPVSSGTRYQMKFVLPVVPVGSPTDADFLLQGPTNSGLILLIERFSAAGSLAVTVPAFNTVSAGTLANVTLAVLTATFTATANGSVTAQGLRTGGTSLTVQGSAYASYKPF